MPRTTWSMSGSTRDSWRNATGKDAEVDRYRYYGMSSLQTGPYGTGHGTINTYHTCFTQLANLHGDFRYLMRIIGLDSRFFPTPTALDGATVPVHFYCPTFHMEYLNASYFMLKVRLSSHISKPLLSVISFIPKGMSHRVLIIKVVRTRYNPHRRIASKTS